MDDDALIFLLIGFAVVAVVGVLAYSLISDGAKAQRRLASFSGSKDRGIAVGKSADPAKRRKAIAESLKEFENEKQKKKYGSMQSA